VPILNDFDSRISRHIKSIYLPNIERDGVGVSRDFLMCQIWQGYANFAECAIWPTEIKIKLVPKLPMTVSFV
jgi:hypothetical protein